jgi:hypothetical protein
MRKFHLVGIALLAVFAFSAVASATASAELVFLLAEWLLNGVAVVLDLVEAEGELLLTDLKGFLGAEAMVLCSGILDGFVEPNGHDLITEVLTLDTPPDTVDLVALGLLALTCVNQVNCATPLVWAVNLPWLTELELHEEGTTTLFVVLILDSGAGKPGWYVQCMGVLGEPSDECTAGTEGGVFEVDNTTPTLTALFSEALTEAMGLKLADCTVGGLEQGEVEGEGLINVPEGGTLTVSSL